MGGCCCSSRKPHLHGTPLYYYCPPRLEVRDSLTSIDGTASAFTARLCVGLDLETSIPDTYQPPPAPLPYDVDLQCPPLTKPEPGGEATGGFSLESLMARDEIDQLDPKSKANSLLSPTKLEQSKAKAPSVVQVEEEDVCPICLEEYDVENPKNLTKCEHHFHFSCLLEWMERSDSCPICDQEMIFDDSFS